MREFFLSAWRAGLRGRAIQAIIVLGVLMVGAAFLAASFSPRQPKTVTLDVGLSGVRISLILLAVYWMQEFVGKEIERKTILMSLAYPIHRTAYLVGRYLGAAGLLSLASLLFGMLLWLAVLSAGSPGYEQGQAVTLGVAYWATIAGLWVDALVVAAFTLFVCAAATTPMLPLMAGLAFAVVGRALGAVADYLAKGADGDVKLVAAYGPAVEAIRWVLPDLSRLDWRAWPMYGLQVDGPTVAASLAMAGGYVVVMCALAAAIFRRREFS
jgi:Cu-processing system permease protein